MVAFLSNLLKFIRKNSVFFLAFHSHLAQMRIQFRDPLGETGLYYVLNKSYVED